MFRKWTLAALLFPFSTYQVGDIPANRPACDT